MNMPNVDWCVQSNDGMLLCSQRQRENHRWIGAYLDTQVHLGSSPSGWSKRLRNGSFPFLRVQESPHWWAKISILERVLSDWLKIWFCECLPTCNTKYWTKLRQLETIVVRFCWAVDWWCSRRMQGYQVQSIRQLARYYWSRLCLELEGFQGELGGFW